MKILIHPGQRYLLIDFFAGVYGVYIIERTYAKIRRINNLFKKFQKILKKGLTNTKIRCIIHFSGKAKAS